MPLFRPFVFIVTRVLVVFGQEMAHKSCVQHKKNSRAHARQQQQQQQHQRHSDYSPLPSPGGSECGARLPSPKSTAVSTDAEEKNRKRPVNKMGKYNNGMASQRRKPKRETKPLGHIGGSSGGKTKSRSGRVGETDGHSTKPNFVTKVQQRKTTTRKNPVMTMKKQHELQQKQFKSTLGGMDFSAPPPLSKPAKTSKLHRAVHAKKEVGAK